MIFKLFVSIFIFITIIAIALADCDIHIKDHLPVKTPVFLRKNQLWAPDGPKLKWRTGETTDLLCSGPSNSIKGEGSEVELKCGKDNQFTINGKSANLTTLECEKQSSASIVNTGENCKNGGLIHKIGFTTSKGFADYIDVCYNLKKAAVVYTYHKIPGQSIDDSLSEPNRPTFSTTGMPKHVKPNNSYKKASQEVRFDKLLGSGMANVFLNSSSYLARGHLAPDNDGIFRSWKTATYYYINVAPQWQSVNAQNWIRVENIARKKATSLQDDLEVYTGNSGVLTLPDKKGKQVEITLENDGSIPAPKYYWKILKYKDAGIAFITINNPFESTEKALCKNVCAEYNWPNAEFETYTKGFTYCCKVSDLAKLFKDDVPNEAITKNILTF